MEAGINQSKQVLYRLSHRRSLEQIPNFSNNDRLKHNESEWMRWGKNEIESQSGIEHGQFYRILWTVVLACPWHSEAYNQRTLNPPIFIILFYLGLSNL